MSTNDFTPKKPLHSGLFQPGVSGNPSGRPKEDQTIRALAKTHTIEAIETLANVMKNEKATPTARVNAACALLDRGWGKPTQYIESMNLNLSDYLDKLAAMDKADSEQAKYQELVIDL